MPCCFFLLRPIFESVYQIQTNNSYHLCKKNILAVDDEPDMTTLLKMALECAGFGIEIFNDPLLALESFNKTYKGW
jgi:PleD family two-component response regulator